MPPPLIPLASPRAAFMEHADELRAAMERVHERGRYLFGPEVEAFESELATALGVRHCIGVASGTDALTLALRAVGVAPGDEVITSGHTAVATVAAIEASGAQVVLADIEPISRCLDPLAVENLVSERTAYSNRLRGSKHLPKTEVLYSRILTLPLFPQMRHSEIERIEDALAEFDS